MPEIKITLGEKDKIRIQFGIGAERNRAMLKEHFTSPQDHKDIDKFFDLLVCFVKFERSMSLLQKNWRKYWIEAGTLKFLPIWLTLC